MNVPARGGVQRTVSESPGAIGGRMCLPRSAPPRHAVGIALELDAVPVHGGGLAGLVDDRDRHALAPLEQSIGPGTGIAVGSVASGVPSITNDMPGLRSVDVRLLALDDPDRPRRLGRRRAGALRRDGDPHHEPEHLVRTVGHVMRSASASSSIAVLGVQRDELREMRGVVAVVDPVARPIRQPTPATSSPNGCSDLRHAHPPLLGRVERVASRRCPSTSSRK